MGASAYSHDYCECGKRREFCLPPDTLLTYRCECGKLVEHRTIANNAPCATADAGKDGE